MRPRRRSDWEARLGLAIAAARARPFAWGVNDCALFAADCVAAITGADFGRPFRGHYRTAKGAARALRRYGAGNLEATVTACLGPPVDPRLAQRGDVVMVETTDGPALGVCVGERAAFPSPSGMAFVPLRQWTKVWRV